MVLRVVMKMIKSFLLFIVGIFKRALCCFRRRRRNSEFVPLTQIGIVTNQTVEVSADNWGDWNEQVAAANSKPSTIQEHIEHYRQQTIASRKILDEQLEAAQENFFQDMAPTITRQTKLLINDKAEDEVGGNRLQFDSATVNVMGQELDEWDDHNPWEEQSLEWDAKEALKESRKQARQKKQLEQQQKRQEKMVRPILGAKVFS